MSFQAAVDGTRKHRYSKQAACKHQCNQGHDDQAGNYDVAFTDAAYKLMHAFSVARLKKSATVYMEMHLYTGELLGEPQPQSEIEEIVWMSKDEVAEKIALMTPMTLDHVMPFLAEQSIW